MIDPNEAPEGYVAVASTDSCKGCAFSDPTLSSRCSRPFCGAPCTLDGGREDGQDVIFIRRDEAPKSAVMTPKQVRDAMFMSVMELHRLRDEFAGRALAGMRPYNLTDVELLEASEGAYWLADAMLHAKFASMTWGKK